MYTHIYIYMNMYIHALISIYICTYICMYMHLCAYICAIFSSSDWVTVFDHPPATLTFWREFSLWTNVFLENPGWEKQGGPPIRANGDRGAFKLLIQSRLMSKSLFLDTPLAIPSFWREFALFLERFRLIKNGHLPQEWAKETWDFQRICTWSVAPRDQRLGERQRRTAW